MEILWLLFVMAALALAYAQIRMRQPTDLFHQEFREKRSGFPDMLRYDRPLKNGIMLGKGGELICTYRYRGPDIDCSSINERAYLRTRTASTIVSMKPGWMIHVTALRYESMGYPDEGYFPDQVTLAIDEERRQQYSSEGSHHENEYFITFTYLPDTIYLNKLKEFAYDTDKSSNVSDDKAQEKIIEHFERTLLDYVSSIEGGLSDKLTRLVPKKKHDTLTNRGIWYDEQMSYIHECISGIRQPIRLPSSVIACGADYIMGSYEYFGGIKPRIGNNGIRVIAVETLPEEGTSFAMLDVLNKLPIQYRWTTRWIARDQEKVKAEVSRIRSKWRQKIHGFIAEFTGKKTGAINTDALAMSLDAEAVLNDINGGLVAYGNWTSTIVLFHEDIQYLDTLAIYTLKQIRNCGFTGRIEEVNSNEAYLGSLPGHGYENVRMPMIHSLNVADLLPLSSTWQGQSENKCEFYKKFYPANVSVPPLMFGTSTGGTPYMVVLHNGDIGHTFMAGPTGSGKSTKLAMLANSHFRYPRAKVYAFDKGESLLASCLGSGGYHYSFMDDDAINGDIGFAPFAHINRLSERTWATDYVLDLLMLNNITTTMDLRDEIRRAINVMSKMPAELRTFTTLATIVQTTTIRQVLNFYESEGAQGILNKKSDNFKLNHFNVFEIEKLMDQSQEHFIPVLLYIFRIIERNLDGSPTMIIFDEGWLALQFEVFIEKLKEWLKVLRKANALVVFATQEIQDVANSPIASTIFSACQTKILLPNSEANSEENMKLYKNIGLTEREVELLTYATPKRDYFFKSPAGRRMYQMELGPIALAFVGVSGIDDRKTIKQLYRTHGSKWVDHWLRLRDINPAILNRERKAA